MEKYYLNFSKEKITARLEDAKHSLKMLEKYKKMALQEFSKEDNFGLASYHLRIGIEAILTIATHVLSRIPTNGIKKDYTQILLSLADYDVLPKDFAKKIKGMAGFRNRMVHLYWKVESKEVLKVIKNDLEDFEEFIKYIKKFLSKNSKTNKSSS